MVPQKLNFTLSTQIVVAFKFIKSFNYLSYNYMHVYMGSRLEATYVNVNMSQLLQHVSTSCARKWNKCFLQTKCPLVNSTL